MQAPAPSRRVISLGWVLLIWIGVTALIALNRGIDLLWGVTMLLVLASVVALLLPAIQVRGVHVRRVKFPATAIVGEKCAVHYEVEARGWLPRYGLELHDTLAGPDSRTPTAFLANVGRREIHSFAWTPRVRGCWQLREIKIESRYPLGLMRSTRRLDAPAHEITVYPDFVRLHWLPVRNDAHPRFEQMVSPRRGGHDEFFGLKQYVPGDEIRSIHWRASARANEIVVKEFEHQQDRQLWILLDLAANKHVGEGAASTVEWMIRIAHSIAVKAFEDGLPVGLIYRVADTVLRVPASADRSTYHRIRDVLARVSAHAQLPLPRWIRRSREQLPAGGTWLMFNLGDDKERGELELLARQRSATPVFVEFDRASFARSVAGNATSHVRTHVSSRYVVSTVPLGADLGELFRP